MKNRLYNKPLAFDQIFNNQPLAATSLGKSISQHIELIIFTGFGEHRHDHKYGCAIWDIDFELITNSYTWEDKFKSALLSSILKLEKRLYQVKMDIAISDIEKKFTHGDNIEAKKKVEVSIQGKIRHTGEDYLFKTSLFLNPLSV